METLLNVLHIFGTLFLILVILLQTGKGAAMGSGLGAGSSQTMFGSAGAGNFLSKLTAGVAILFLVTSLSLAILSSKKDSKSVIGDISTTTETSPQEKKDPSPK
ncbi:MAG: preprotein translocase subunit SecG [Nitrospinae bacterium CG11_big_fil_rev_8_21_14_0_20_45_15]|nr:MAG: preprotein translocase subunit SecG [Nitrospinae bacterium CG11_big_fil_rev_8_21_14_0_20_45_15]